ncbi:hypothetical protein Dimus_031311 [Dionaea muscipula]
MAAIYHDKFATLGGNGSHGVRGKLVESSQNLRPGMTTYPRKKRTEDGEIDVFSADKYFNGGGIINLSTPRSDHSKRDEDYSSEPVIQSCIHSQSSRFHKHNTLLLRTTAVSSNSLAKDDNYPNRAKPKEQGEATKLVDNMIVWDAAIPRNIIIEETDEPDDAESDASSDLFEIDCPSTCTSINAQSCYPPSEASIEWSVVTASSSSASTDLPAAAAMSDNHPQRLAKTSPVNNEDLQKQQRRRPPFAAGMLLLLLSGGCRSEKAVRVAMFRKTRAIGGRSEEPLTQHEQRARLLEKGKVHGSVGGCTSSSLSCYVKAARKSRQQHIMSCT